MRYVLILFSFTLSLAASNLVWGVNKTRKLLFKFKTDNMYKIIAGWGGDTGGWGKKT